MEPERMRVRMVLTALVPALAACGGRAGGSQERWDDIPAVPERGGLDDIVAETGTDEPDPGDPTAAPDPTEAADRPETSAAPDPTEAPDLSDWTDSNDALDPAGAPDLSDAPVLPDPLDLPDETDALDAWDASDTPGSPDAPDSSDEPEAPVPADLPDPPPDPGPPPPPYTCWSDSFEWDADPGWEATGLWHRIHAGQDLVNVFAAPPYGYVVLDGPATLTKPKDGTRAFWYGRDEDGSYLGSPDTNQVAGGGTSSEPHEGALVSPWLDLTGAASATLYFWSWWEIESQHPADYDLSTVEVTKDGETWTEVVRLNPRTVPAGAHPVLPYTVNGVGMPPSWHRSVVPLGAYAGGLARVRFRFRTGDVFYNAFRGWVVDEVSIECVPQVGSIPTSPKSSR